MAAVLELSARYVYYFFKQSQPISQILQPQREIKGPPPPYLAPSPPRQLQILLTELNISNRRMFQCWSVS